MIEDNMVNNWFRQRCALITLLYQVHQRQVLQTKYLCVDETPTKVLDKTKKALPIRDITGYITTPKAGSYCSYTRQALRRSGQRKCSQLIRIICRQTGMPLIINLMKCTVLLPLIVGAHALYKFIDAWSFDAAKAVVVLTQIQLL